MTKRARNKSLWVGEGGAPLPPTFHPRALFSRFLLIHAQSLLSESLEQAETRLFVEMT